MALLKACKHLRPRRADRPEAGRRSQENYCDSGLEFALQGTTLIHIFPALTESGKDGELR